MRGATTRKADAARVIASPDLRAHVASAPSPRLFVALWGGLAVVDVARAAQAPPTVQVLLLDARGSLCVGQRVGAALAVAGIVWLVATGFVVNTLGRAAPDRCRRRGAGLLVPGRLGATTGGGPMTAAIADPVPGRSHGRTTSTRATPGGG